MPRALHPKPGAAPAVNGEANTRPTVLREFEQAMVAFFVETSGMLGIPVSIASIYGVIFASPTPLSFAEIESRLKISKGSLSQGLRSLRGVGAINEVSAANDKAELFVPELEMRKLIARYLESRLDVQMTQGHSRLTGLKASLKSLPPGDRKILADRVGRLENWHDRTRRLLPLIRAFLKL